YTEPGLENEKRFQCKNCGNCYTQPYNLKRHVRYECGKEPQFQCPLCNYKCKRRNGLRCHLLNKHKNHDIPLS
ncbi:hypothetical protein ILUMI_18958, partial [Ignelater luminosus]